MGLFDKLFNKNKKEMTVEEKLLDIEALRNTKPPKKKKKEEGTGDDERATSQLITYLSDTDPKCRIAAAKALQNAAKEMVLSGLRNAVLNEKDPEAEKAMRETMVQVRKNIEANK